MFWRLVYEWRFGGLVVHRWRIALVGLKRRVVLLLMRGRWLIRFHWLCRLSLRLLAARYGPS